MTTIDVPSKYRRMYRRAMSGRSRKAAIRVHCLMCVGWVESEVVRCTADVCPLFPYRNSAAAGPNRELSQTGTSASEGGAQ